MIFVKSIGGSIIRNVTIKVADKNDLEFMLDLESLGMKRTLACVITFLKDQNERSLPGYRGGHRPEAARGQHHHANPEKKKLAH